MYQKTELHIQLHDDTFLTALNSRTRPDSSGATTQDPSEAMSSSFAPYPNLGSNSQGPSQTATTTTSQIDAQRKTLRDFLKRGQPSAQAAAPRVPQPQTTLLQKLRGLKRSPVQGPGQHQVHRAEVHHNAIPRVNEIQVPGPAWPPASSTPGRGQDQSGGDWHSANPFADSGSAPPTPISAPPPNHIYQYNPQTYQYQQPRYSTQGQVPPSGQYYRNPGHPGKKFDLEGYQGVNPLATIIGLQANVIRKTHGARRIIGHGHREYPRGHEGKCLTSQDHLPPWRT